MPKNIFVASFIGSPPMNIIEGEISENVFQSEKVKVAVDQSYDGKIYLGFRAEDVEMIHSKDEADIVAEVYSLEYLGDATLISVQINNQLVLFKASKDYRAKIGTIVFVKVPTKSCHFFEFQSGNRIYQ